MKNIDIKIKVQVFGRFLSNMVMPNMGAFIAWGFITALFIKDGWIPNDDLVKLVDPMIFYLLPLLVAYSGGNIIYKQRGGVVAATATMGIIVGTSIPMFLGAMIMGPLAAYLMKSFDNLVKGKIKSGFEMLVSNFSAGILAMLLAIVGFYAFSPAVTFFTNILTDAVSFLVDKNLLPLASIIIEPAKVLFLNNALNHGIFTPLGAAEVLDKGKSVLFMMETNPGPGVGLLLAFMFFGKGKAKASASGAAIIHFFGGIHEVYFPFVLMKPAMFLSVIIGGIVGVFTNVILSAGLVASPAPGSIVAYLLMSPKNLIFINLIGIIASAIVTFLVSFMILKAQKEKEGSEESFENTKNSITATKNKIKNSLLEVKVNKIVVACDAGMGSSAMGASILKKKIKEAKLNINVINMAISDLEDNDEIDILITQKELTARAKKKLPNVVHISIDNFMDESFYNNLVLDLSKDKSNIKSNNEDISKKENNKFINENQIFLNLASVDKESAIIESGKKLVDLGFVNSNYINAMIEREKQVTTYIGNNIAIPHGTEQSKKEIIKSGIAILQYPNGIDFNGEKAYLVIAIAGKDNQHLEILSYIANVLIDSEIVLKLSQVKDKIEFMKLFNKLDI